ncbi:MAG: HicB family protein [Eubacteriaceae bacterium]|nr:HicB family protein [Eubacteriaceae bacterium]
MRKLTYPAVLEPSKNGYKVFFPDLPGCKGFGETIEQARANAKQVLEQYIYTIERDGGRIPEKTADLSSAAGGGSIIIAVSAYPELVKNEMDNRRLKVAVTLPSWLKNKADKKAVDYSKILEAALIEYLGTDR